MRSLNFVIYNRVIEYCLVQAKIQPFVLWVRQYEETDKGQKKNKYRNFANESCWTLLKITVIIDRILCLIRCALVLCSSRILHSFALVQFFFLCLATSAAGWEGYFHVYSRTHIQTGTTILPLQIISSWAHHIIFPNTPLHNWRFRHPEQNAERKR